MMVLLTPDESQRQGITNSNYTKTTNKSMELHKGERVTVNASFYTIRGIKINL